jgi:hypothetical protein
VAYPLVPAFKMIVEHCLRPIPSMRRPRQADLWVTSSVRERGSRRIKKCTPTAPHFMCLGGCMRLDQCKRPSCLRLKIMPCQRRSRLLGADDWQYGRASCRGDTRKCLSFLTMAFAAPSRHHLPRQEPARRLQAAAQRDAGTARPCPPRPCGLAVPTSHDRVPSTGTTSPTHEAVRWGRREGGREPGGQPGNATGTLGPWRAVPAPPRELPPVPPACCPDDRTPQA